MKEPVPTMYECEQEGHTLDKFEWWDICRRVKPRLTWAEYEQIWDEFQEFKQRKKLQ